jgi:hypothetical protein
MKILTKKGLSKLKDTFHEDCNGVVGIQCPVLRELIDSGKLKNPSKATFHGKD